jgi:hypothetical protein
MSESNKYWTYKGKPITSISEMQKLLPKVIGFVYRLTLKDKKTGEVKFLYIGKKNLYTKRKRNFGKKETAALKDKRRKTYEHVIKESNWATYYSSSKLVKQYVGKLDIDREIIKFCDTDADLTYQEAKEIMCNDAVIHPKYLNESVKITRYRGFVEM